MTLVAIDNRKFSLERLCKRIRDVIVESMRELMSNSYENNNEESLMNCI